MDRNRPPSLEVRTEHRRQFLSRCGLGLGAAAFQWLLSSDGFGAPAIKIDPAHPLTPRKPHFAPRAKQVIFLFMAGGPSQLELFEDKPKLRELNGQPPPPSLLKGKRF